MALTLCVLLNAVPGNEARLVEYEDQVLELLPAHGARVLQRVRAVDGTTDPFEVHVLEFPSEAALEQYLEDPVRVALTGLRDGAIASSQIVRVAAVSV